MNLIDNLNWRYATKKMSHKKVGETELNFILEATRLSASSYGLQPYTIFVVSNEDVKAKLLLVGYNQPQIIESSYLLVFTVPTELTVDHVAAYMKDIANTRGVELSALESFSDLLKGTIKGLTVEQQQVWSTKQAYIALGTALAAAAEQRVDASPMEGFVPDGFDEVLGLKEKGLKSVVIMALGYRSEADEMAKAPKVRKDKATLYQFLP